MADDETLVQQIHASPMRVVLAITGGGSRAIARLLEVAGGSRTLLEAQVPYSAESLSDYLGSAPEHACCARTARAMAVAAYLRARYLCGDVVSSGSAVPRLDQSVRDGAGAERAALAGVACTASLASERPKRGAHRCHVAVQDATSTTTYSLQLTKGCRDRRSEEAVVSDLILSAVAGACRLAGEVPPALIGREAVQSRRSEATGAVVDLFSGKRSLVFAGRDGHVAAIEDRAVVTAGPVQTVLPGAFDPLHEGHRMLARAAADLLGTEVVYELSLTNVDKPPLSYTDLEDRLAGFRGKADVVLTRAPSFAQKARLLPGCTFVVGYDTALRIVAPRYYGGEQAMLDALDAMQALGTRFLVAGRLEGNRFHTLADVPVPARHASMFGAIPESTFRRDVSSTALRAAGAREE